MGTAVRPAPLLLVDDDPAVRTALKFALEIDGYEVETFPDAESLAACPRLPAEGCLVVDLQLPGMDGLELVEVLRRRAVRLPALLITTHPNAQVRSRAKAAGVDIVEKPLLAETLGEAINRALTAPPPG
ncbi:FixJ family two-component response regulator [Phenylobacterium haematophilum]|jgi:FixJ family two-component response regulator|uniref:FixJ family two-component response regulator n=1 Tax=Phenylobacterium haematophilum TaxID=98513 RepID=A0A839ZUG7_9CAUL|nr:response regulator [Phenylobacterium haematophilum]MBB3889658.1 FixJ family two-component response regulator [Phenylobacterium haematophilum]